MPIRPLMFLSSYTPLFAILGFRFIPSAVGYVCFALALLGLSVTLLWLRAPKGQNGHQYIVKDVHEAGSEAAGYLASYLLPFFNVPSPGVRDILVYGGFLITAGAIFINSSVMRINPTLYLMKRSVFEITDENDRTFFLVTAPGHKVRRHDVVTAVDMGDGVMIQKITAS